MAGIFSAEIALLSDLCLRMILRQDPEHELVLSEKVYRGIWLYCVLIGIWIQLFLTHWGILGQLSCGCLAAYLLVASVTDLQTHMVYDFLHIIMGAPLAVFLLVQTDFTGLWSVTLFLVIQLVLFMRLYGAADGMAFVVCALFECRFGRGLLTFLLHMGAAFALMALVQALRRNINRQGNLKTSVPFLPYITATVWLFL